MPGKIPLDDPNRGELFDATLDALTAKGFFDVKRNRVQKGVHIMPNSTWHFDKDSFKIVMNSEIAETARKLGSLFDDFHLAMGRADRLNCLLPCDAGYQFVVIQAYDIVGYLIGYYVMSLGT